MTCNFEVCRNTLCCFLVGLFFSWFIILDTKRTNSFLNPLLEYRQDFSTPTQYYRWQRPILKKRAKKFYLNYCWDLRARGKVWLPPVKINYSDMVIQRFKALRRKVRLWQRKDAYIVRDKCLLHRFLLRNKFPSATMQTWNNLTELEYDIKSGIKLLENDTVSSFSLSCCHLDFKAENMMSLESSTWIAAHQDDILGFINSMSFTDPAETERVWPQVADGIIGRFNPGFLLRNTSRFLSYHDEHDTMRIFKVKTLVFWGRAYVGMLDVDGSTRFKDQTVVFLRENTIGDFDHHNPFSWMDFFYLHSTLNRYFQAFPYLSWSWIYTKKYLKCVWNLSQKVAQAMAIDHLQVDIIIVRSNPEGCLVGDISLYTDEDFGPHEKYFSRLWAEPLRREIYNYFGSHLNPQAFDFTPSIPNRKELQG